ncbi:MAG: helix-turn-helix domain-containing protein [Acutalibacteraceae bacterium]
MNDYKKEMGTRIRVRRKKLLLTQEEISEQLGISVKHFSEVERGLTGLSIENLIKLSNILGLSLDFIIKGKSVKCNWDSTLSLLENVPKEKEDLIKDLIKLGIQLSQN